MSCFPSAAQMYAGIADFFPLSLFSPFASLSYPFAIVPVPKRSPFYPPLTPYKVTSNLLPFHFAIPAPFLVGLKSILKPINLRRFHSPSWPARHPFLFPFTQFWSASIGPAWPGCTSLCTSLLMCILRIWRVR